MHHSLRDNAIFIDHTMTYLSSLFGSERVAFYQVLDDREMEHFIFHNIDHNFHRSYISEMYAFDPLHISRLHENTRSTRLHLLRQCEKDCPRNAVEAYRSFLNSFDVADVCELLFSFEGHIVAGASILYADLQLSDREDAHIQAAHAYIEFNLGQHMQQSDQYVRAALGKRFGLSSREIDVIELLCCGRTNSEIGELLQIGIATVKTHLIRIYQKLGVENRSSVVAFLAELR